MKKKALIVLTTAIIAVSGVFYGFTSNITGAVAAATETPTIDTCPLAGSPDCPLIQNYPDKGTADCQSDCQLCQQQAVAQINNKY